MSLAVICDDVLFINPPIPLLIDPEDDFILIAFFKSEKLLLNIDILFIVPSNPLSIALKIVL